MTDEPGRAAPRRMHSPLLDTLGQSIQNGKELASYLWQVPGDADAHRRIEALVATIRKESAAQGRREMGRVCDEIERAAGASPTPQQVELLQDGFERLYKLWLAAKSGIM
ncbi:MAG TPA: hypothetical protein VLC11_04335 [Gemmatimonadales bacterium]|nr:hypothetical protein [Gemmatimonadales bacterium]